MNGKQSIIGSLLESFIAALLAAPSSNLLHWIMLDLWGNELSNPEIKAHYMFWSWVSFFIHSMVWKFIIRRVFVRYPRLDPKT